MFIEERCLIAVIVDQVTEALVKKYIIFILVIILIIGCGDSESPQTVKKEIIRINYMELGTKQLKEHRIKGTATFLTFLRPLLCLVYCERFMRVCNFEGATVRACISMPRFLSIKRSLSPLSPRAISKKFLVTDLAKAFISSQKSLGFIWP